jgi:hypothetical protein
LAGLAGCPVPGGFGLERDVRGEHERWDGQARVLGIDLDAL